jgi:TetR/AcrR family transcriptional repressor of nem operon
MLQTTLELIWLHGYGSITVDCICERAEIQKGSFYHFFRSKGEVAAAALDAYWESIYPDFERIFGERSVPAIQRIINYFDHVYRRQLQRRRATGQVMGCPFVTLGTEVIKHDNLLSAKTRELMERYCRYFEGALREARANREIQIDQPRIKARELYAYLIGSMVQARIRNDTGILRQLSAGVWPILRSSAAAPKAQKFSARPQGDIRPNLRRRKRRLPPLPSERPEQKPELSLTRDAAL